MQTLHPPTRPSAALGLAMAAWLCAACATPLAPHQRQQLETRVYESPYEATFAAARETFVNQGYTIVESDREGGFLSLSQHALAYNARRALTYSILFPPVGDFYMNRHGWALFDTVSWPYSIVWSATSNYRLARTRTKEVTGTVFFERLSENRTRVRVSIGGAEWDTEDYPRTIRYLQEEIDRQLFLREGDAFAVLPDEP